MKNPPRYTTTITLHKHSLGYDPYSELSTLAIPLDTKTLDGCVVELADKKHDLENGDFEKNTGKVAIPKNYQNDISVHDWLEINDKNYKITSLATPMSCFTGWGNWVIAEIQEISHGS